MIWVNFKLIISWGMIFHDILQLSVMFFSFLTFIIGFFDCFNCLTMLLINSYILACFFPWSIRIQLEYLFCHRVVQQ